MKDTGRFLLAIVLMIGVIITTNLLFPPVPADPTGMAADSSAIAPDSTVTPVPQRDSTASTAAAPTAPALAGVAPMPAETLWIASDLYRYGISTAGGSVVGAALLGYESFTREGSVELAVASGEPLLALSIRVGDAVLDLRQLAFAVESVTDTTVVLRHQDPAGRFDVRISYAFDPSSYLADVRVETTELGGVETLQLHLPPALAINEVRAEDDHRALAYVVNSTREGIHSVRLDDVDERRIEEGPLRWLALKNKYFLVAALADSGGAPFGGLIAEPLDRSNAARLTGTLAGVDNVFAFRLFMGPQEYARLTAIGNDFADVNPYGWKIFRPIIRPFAHLILWALDGLHDGLGIGYGWALILFGVLIRIVLWPLNAKAMRSQLKTMELQPLIKEIQAKYKNEPEKLQREMIRLYKEEGFNPLGGCLPLLLPWPILITLFFVFQSTIAFRGVGFLWLPDLSQPDPLFLLPVIMGASIFLLQWLNLRVNPDPTPQMKMLTYFMPVMLTVMFLYFASGLNLYYAASNIASLPQQLQIMNERKKIRRKQA